MEIRFDDVWGQTTACSLLSQNARLGRVASSYLFSGPTGAGKTKSAMIFAKALLCQAPSGLPCGACRSCKMFDAETHPDFLHLLPDGAMIKIEQLRELITALSFKSYLGGRKVCVMGDADAMNRTTANAFLKTLEEPPGNTVIILVSSNMAAILPTVVSRCRMVRFVPMEPGDLARKLVERQGMNGDEALRVAILSEGCAGIALGGSVESVKAVDDEAVTLMGRIRNMTVGEIVEFSQRWKNRREDLPVLLERIAETLRFSLSLTSSPLSGTMMELMKKFGEIPEERILDSFDFIMDLVPLLKLNPNVQLFLEALMFNMQSILERGYPIWNGI